jgi:cyclophilin family peptidyl-prolyl cis-trans isomerase/predicted DsbA family dithiol-disulfide isomerase
MVNRSTWRFHLIYFLISIALFFSACSPGSTGSIISGSSTPPVRSGFTPTPLPCTLLHVAVTPEATIGSMFEGHGHTSGSKDAPVTIITFSDYQCTECAILAASLKQIRIIHSKDVRLIYLHAPQANHDKDDKAIQAVEAADLQGKFWEMHDLLFAQQREWYSLPPADFEAWAVRQAVSLGMDKDRFRSDYEGSLVADRLKQAVQFASSGISFAPPVLFVNSTSPYTGLVDLASLDAIVRMDALTSRQYSNCPTRNVNPLKQYIATFQLEKGDVVFQLFPEESPLAVSNFISLAKSGWYDNISFYRVIPGQIVMSGDPSGTGYGNPGYLFDTEISASLNFDQPGMLAMDNNGPDTNGSRFFINLAPQDQINGQYTIIGKVISGMNVLSTLNARNPQPGIYLPPGDVMIRITIEER